MDKTNRGLLAELYNIQEEEIALVIRVYRRISGDEETPINELRPKAINSLVAEQTDVNKVIEKLGNNYNLYGQNS